MGEAKRRKQLLGKNYGKQGFSSQKSKLSIINKSGLQFYYEAPKSENFFDPGYGMVFITNSRDFSAYINERMGRAKLIYGAVDIPDTRLKEYVDANILKLIKARTIAEGIILGAIHPESPIFQKILIHKLLSLSLIDNNLIPDRCVYLGGNREITRAIGQELHRIGGSELMSFVANELVPFFDSGELDICWDGIGSWRC